LNTNSIDSDDQYYLSISARIFAKRPLTKGIVAFVDESTDQIILHQAMTWLTPPGLKEHEHFVKLIDLDITEWANSHFVSPGIGRATLELILAKLT
jgi:hypothetical protein